MIIPYLNDLEIPEASIDSWYAVSAQNCQDQITNFINSWISANWTKKEETIDVLVVDRNNIYPVFGGLPEGGWEEYSL